MARAAAQAGVGALLGFLAATASFAQSPPPNITLTGSCDTFGDSTFTITNTGAAMTVPYSWELYQNSLFLTSGPFTLTANGTQGSALQLTINGLYGNLAALAKDNSGLQVANATAYCPKRPTVRMNQAAGQSDPAFAQPLLYTAVFDTTVTGFGPGGVTVSGMAAPPTIVVTDSGDHKTFTVAISGAADGETVRARVRQDAATGGSDGLGNELSTFTDNTITYRTPPNITLTGSCDTFGDSTFTITNTGAAMTVPYSWELYQNSLFLTSGPFTLTANGTQGSALQLTINGLYGNLAALAKDNSGLQVANATAYCPKRPTVRMNQAAGQSDPAFAQPLLYTAVFDTTVTGFGPGGVTVSGMAAPPTIVVTDSGDHKTFTVAISGAADGETVRARVRQDAATGGSDGLGNELSTFTDNSITFQVPANYPIATSVTPPAGGSLACVPNPVPIGGDATCTATPQAGYTFSSFGGDCSGSICQLKSVLAPKTVTATFTSNTYPVTATALPPGSGSVTCTPSPVSHGSTTTCAATPQPGYTFSTFGGDCSGATCVLANVQAPKTVTATFTSNTYPVTATALPPGSGSVTCTPSPVSHGSATTCTATPQPGYAFSTFGGDCTGATCVLANVQAPKTVTATFALNTYPVTATAIPPESGSVTCAPSPVSHGSATTCTATPQPGYAFSTFGGDCTGATCVLTNVQAPKTVTATFAPVTSFDGLTAAGTGRASVSFSGGGAQCRIDPAGTGFVAAQAEPPLPGAQFPHGWLRLKLVGCDNGATVRVSVQWPSLPSPPSLDYLKYGPTPESGGQAVFYQAPRFAVAGGVTSYDVTDGGFGDDDLAADGTIVDPAGPLLLPPVAVPALDPRLLLLMAGMLAGIGLAAAHRQFAPR